MSRDTSFDDLIPGDFVHDMHDGLEPLKARFTIVSWVQWRIPGETITYRGKRSGEFGLPNKELRVIGERTGVSGPELVCGYDYDGMFSGIVVLSSRQSAS